MKLKRMFTSRRFRAGGYSAFAMAVVVAIAVAANAIVGALPASLTQIDKTEQAPTRAGRTARFCNCWKITRRSPAM